MTPGNGLYVSELQQRPVDVLMIPPSTFGSMPSASPSDIASATPAIVMPSTRLLQIFATCPVPVSPQRTMFFPIADSTGLTCSNAATLPPTMNVNVPAAAPPVPPETGASTNGLPCFVASSAHALTVAGSIVLESMIVTPFGMPASTPSSAVSTLFTWAAAGSIVITHSTSVTAAFAEPDALAPASTSVCTACAFRSNTLTVWPAFSRLSAIGAPMLPSPMKPIFMMSSPYIRGWERLAQADRRVDAVVHGRIIEPARRDGLGLRVELHDLLAIRAEIAELRSARTREAEERHRHRNRNVDADLAHVDIALELARRRAALREQSNAVAKRIRVDEFDRVVERRYGQDQQHRAEDLGAIDFHVGRDVGEDRRADEVAVFVAAHLDVAAVERERRAFLHARFDQPENALFRGTRHNRADIRSGLVTGVDLQRLRLLDEIRQPLLRRAHQHDHRGRHAALSRRAKTGSGERVECL